MTRIFQHCHPEPQPLGAARDLTVEAWILFGHEGRRRSLCEILHFVQDDTALLAFGILIVNRLYRQALAQSLPRLSRSHPLDQAG
jgi:hypothetical protein